MSEYPIYVKSRTKQVPCGMSTEIRVADLVRQGYKSKEIAKIIGVSYKTVESHREKIRKKLNITQKKTNLRAFLLSVM